MKVVEAEFIKVPKSCKDDILDTTQEQLDKVFSNMLNHKYKICESGMSKRRIYNTARNYRRSRKRISRKYI